MEIDVILRKIKDAEQSFTEFVEESERLICQLLIDELNTAMPEGVVVEKAFPYYEAYVTMNDNACVVMNTLFFYVDGKGYYTQEFLLRIEDCDKSKIKKCKSIVQKYISIFNSLSQLTKSALRY